MNNRIIIAYSKGTPWEGLFWIWNTTWGGAEVVCIILTEIGLVRVLFLDLSNFASWSRCMDWALTIGHKVARYWMMEAKALNSSGKPSSITSSWSLCETGSSIDSRISIMHWTWARYSEMDFSHLVMELSFECSWRDFTLVCAKTYLWISSQIWWDCTRRTTRGSTESESVVRSHVNRKESYCSQVTNVGFSESLMRSSSLRYRGGILGLTRNQWSLWVRMIPSIWSEVVFIDVESYLLHEGFEDVLRSELQHRLCFTRRILCGICRIFIEERKSLLWIKHWIEC